MVSPVLACYFHHTKDGDEKRSATQAHTLDGIIVGRSSTSNAILVYNPRSRKYYEPDTYRIDPYRLPCSVYSDVRYDGGLFCSLLRDDNPTQEEPYPPGTRVEDLDPVTRVLRAGTVMDIPMDPAQSPHYLIGFDDGTRKQVRASDMPGIIPAPPQPPSNVADESLPPFLRDRSRVTYERDGSYQKGFLKRTPEGFRFSCWTHVNRKSDG